MTDLLLQFGASNLCISFALAIVAWSVHATGKRPFVAHLLWLLVLAKLVTPPILTIPVVPVPVLSVTARETLTDHFELEATSTSLIVSDPVGSSAAIDQNIATPTIERTKTGLVMLWAFGSVCVLGWSLVRIYRFNRLLGMASEVAPRKVQRIASEIAQRLGLKATPIIYTTSAQLSPLVWWLGGRVRILIPAALPREMDAEQLRWILAHELAHVRRRDHLVRWLEWLACICFWWNPVAWWARRNLRINEEICCDALVLSSLKPDPHSYASSLMTVVEFLASPALRPPAMASEINSGGFLERRFRMIISAHPVSKTPRWLLASILLVALTLMPLGVGYAQDHDTKKNEAKAEKGEAATKRITQEDFSRAAAEVRQAIAEGKLTVEQGRARLDVMREAMTEQSEREAEMMWRRVAGALGEHGIERDKIRDVIGVMKRIVAGMRSGGDAFELQPKLQARLVELGLTDEQIERVVGLSRRVAASPAAKRADDITRRIAGELGEAGIERDKVRNVMGTMRRIMTDLKSGGDAFQLDPAIQAHLTELGLSAEQVRFVVGLSRRVMAASADSRRRREEDMKRRVAAHRHELDILLDRKEELLRLYAGLNELREGLSQQAVAARADWDAIEKRIEDAVERGDMTREEADAKYAEFKKTAAAKKKGDLEAILKRVRALEEAIVGPKAEWDEIMKKAYAEDG